VEARSRLLDQVRNQLRTLQDSYRTEQQYLSWVLGFMLQRVKHVKTMQIFTNVMRKGANVVQIPPGH
jgi:hypothetical protein